MSSNPEGPHGAVLSGLLASLFNTSHTLSWNFWSPKYIVVQTACSANVLVLFFKIINMLSYIFSQTLLCTHWLRACPTMSCIHLVQLFVVLYACKFIDQMYQNYLQNKTREQLTISCGVVMTSSPLDSGSVRFSACENCCSDAISIPPSLDMAACLEIFCRFHCTYGGATWTNPLTSIC